MHSSVEGKDATTDNKTLSPDLRVYAWVNEKGKLLLGITDPHSTWGRAGLHTNEEILTMNNFHVTKQKDFFDIISKQKSVRNKK